VLLALQAVIVTYDGWYFAIYFTEEDNDPARNLPRSSIVGVLACIAVYVLMNMALLHVLPMNKLAGSEVPGADAAMAIFGGRGKQFILVLAMVTVLSALNATVLLSCRILFGMGRDGWLPRWLASVNSGGTPSAALLVVSLASIVLILGCVPCCNRCRRPQGRSFHTDPDLAELPRLLFRSEEQTASGKRQRCHRGSARVTVYPDIIR